MEIHITYNYKLKCRGIDVLEVNNIVKHSEKSDLFSIIIEAE
jgi:hypothetical protein